MSNSDASSPADTEIAGPVVIGIAFGNTNSSISYSNSDGKPELMANEEGGMYNLICNRELC